MRADQFQKLEGIVERLSDVFIVEADPANWTGSGVMPADMTPDIRGNRHWDRKGAVGTATVLAHSLNLIKHYRERAALSPGGVLPEDETAMLDKNIRSAEQRAEKAAAAAVDRAMKRGAKATGERVRKP